jgi:hypothetical protein
MYSLTAKVALNTEQKFLFDHSEYIYILEGYVSSHSSQIIRRNKFKCSQFIETFLQHPKKQK